MDVADFLRPEGWLSRGSGPRYVQLRRRLEEGIEDGILPPNSSLPPEREIAEITDLSVSNVGFLLHSAIAKLRQRVAT